MNRTDVVFRLSKLTWAKTAGAIVEHFGGFSTRVLLGSENIQSPKNAMILASNVHTFFDELDLWLTPFKVDLVSSLCSMGLPLSLDCRIAESLSPTSTRSISLMIVGVDTSAPLPLFKPTRYRVVGKLNLLHLSSSLSTPLVLRSHICPVLWNTWRKHLWIQNPSQL